MRAASFNPDLIRPALVMLFFVIALFLQAKEKAKRSKATRSVAATETPKGSSLELLREAMRQASEQARMRRGQSPIESDPVQLGAQQFQQPPTIEPESSIVPSLLLLALLVCLCLLAFRYWAR